jgi:hypothetical protein
VFGERDEMIPVELSALRIAEASARGANEDVEVRVVPGANHALQPGTQAFEHWVAWVGQRTGVE